MLAVGVHIKAVLLCQLYFKLLIFLPGILRKIVLEIPALFILNSTVGLYGLAYAQFCAEVILATAAILVLRRLFSRLEAADNLHRQ